MYLSLDSPSKGSDVQITLGGIHCLIALEGFQLTDGKNIQLLTFDLLFLAPPCLQFAEAGSPLQKKQITLSIS